MIFQAASGNYSRYLSCSDYHDMTVRVIGDGDIRVFKLHRIVLCNASGYFRDQVPKSGTKCTSLSIFVSPRIFELYLELVYKCEVTVPDEDVQAFRNILTSFETREVLPKILS